MRSRRVSSRTVVEEVCSEESFIEGGGAVAEDIVGGCV